jgi:hypothetical protein
MLTKEISEVEKEIEQEFKMLNKGYGSHEARDRNIDLLREKLSTLKYCQAKFCKGNNPQGSFEMTPDNQALKSAQAKFDKFVEDLKTKINNEWDCWEDYTKGEKKELISWIDELSSKQEKTE